MGVDDRTRRIPPFQLVAGIFPYGAQRQRPDARRGKRDSRNAGIDRRGTVVVSVQIYQPGFYRHGQGSVSAERARP